MFDVWLLEQQIRSNLFWVIVQLMMRRRFLNSERHTVGTFHRDQNKSHGKNIDVIVNKHGKLINHFHNEDKRVGDFS